MRYAVVEYNDDRKEQSFNIKMVTEDVELAKKVAFNNAKKNIPARDKGNHKITSKFEAERYLMPNNKIIIEYTIISGREVKNKFKVSCTYSNIHAVVELKQNALTQEQVGDIDLNLLCNNYIGSDCEFDEEDDEEEDYEIPPLK